MRLSLNCFREKILELYFSLSQRVRISANDGASISGSSQSVTLNQKRLKIRILIFCVVIFLFSERDVKNHMANVRKAGPGFPNRRILRPNGPKNGVPLAESIQFSEWFINYNYYFEIIKCLFLTVIVPYRSFALA